MRTKTSRLFPILTFVVLGAWLPQGLGITSQGRWSLFGGAIGFLFGSIFERKLWDLLVGSVRARCERISLSETMAIGLGLLFGLVFALLGLVLLHQIGGGIHPGWKIMGAFSSILTSITLLRTKEEALASLLCLKERTEAGGLPLPRPSKVLDTSAIIDGRIADICKTGFLEGTLLVPSFVLAELQKIADSSDSLKRNRGRRGLEILNRMQKEGAVTVRVYDQDFEDLADVDTKIVRLARMLGAKVITNDFNLNKVAELYGVSVLNINDLSNAIKPIVLPGEEILVHLVKDGKEFGQGIGYLDDGTMVVVDGGRPHIGEDLEIVVTSVLQTSAGRMIFGKPKELVRVIAQNQ